MRKFFTNYYHFLFVLFLIVVAPTTILSQSFNMCNSTGTVTACSGTVYDPGGVNGNYANNQNCTLTVCSGNGQQINLTFTSMNLESNFDFIKIYNGTNTNPPNLIGSYTGTTLPGTVSSNTTCITLIFTSDGSVTYSGFAATISCGTPPPPPPAPPGDACNSAIPF